MEIAQSSPSMNTSKTVEPYKNGEFDAYISYLALGGLITGDDGSIRKMTLEDFAEAFNVDRKTLYNWKTQTPNIGEMIRQRREELMPVARETAWYNQLHLLGMQTQDKRAAVDALRTLTGHFSGLRLPSQDVKHEVTDALAEAMSLVKQRRQRDSEAIEGEVIDEPRY